MTETPGAIRHIAWRELFPWLILFRTFRVAISPTLLILATAAVLIHPIGWWIGGRVFLTDAERTVREQVNDVVPQAANSQLIRSVPEAVKWFFPLPSPPILDAFFDLAEPLKRFFLLELTFRECAYYAFGFLWTLAVWAFPGGVITRRAIVQLATDLPTGIRREVGYSCRRYLWYLLAPLYPILGLALLAVPIAVLGLLLRIAPGFGALVAGFSWLLVAIASLGAMWLFGGLIFGWPLMWPTISAERDGDPFEAFSRSYSYVYGKPLHYFWYVVVAAAFGALCWAVVAVAVQLVEEFGFWALSWGGGGQRVAELRDDAFNFALSGALPGDEGRIWIAGAVLIGLVVGLIEAVKWAFRFTFFFSAASAIYLLLRHDVDEKETDEVFLDEPELGSPMPPAPQAAVAAAAPAAAASGESAPGPV